MNEPAAFDSHIRLFEETWQKGQPPEIADFLAGAKFVDQSSLLRRDLLIELICIDLEFRWKHQCAKDPPTLDHYVRQFSELGLLDDLPVNLIGEEYRVRHLWGDAPTHDAFIARFTKQQESIRAMIEQVDLELLGETEDEPIPVTVHAPRVISEYSSDDSAPKNSFSDQITQALPAQSLADRISARDSAKNDTAAPLPYSDYLLQRQIGTGAMGKVYQALQKSLDRPVAVKYLRKSFLRQPHAVERFVTEARTVARFHHPGIVGIQGLGRTVDTSSSWTWLAAAIWGRRSGPVP